MALGRANKRTRDQLAWDNMFIPTIEGGGKMSHEEFVEELNNDLVNEESTNDIVKDIANSEARAVYQDNNNILHIHLELLADNADVAQRQYKISQLFAGKEVTSAVKIDWSAYYMIRNNSTNGKWKVQTDRRNGGTYIGGSSTYTMGAASTVGVFTYKIAFIEPSNSFFIDDIDPNITVSYAHPSSEIIHYHWDEEQHRNVGEDTRFVIDFFVTLESTMTTKITL